MAGQRPRADVKGPEVRAPRRPPIVKMAEMVAKEAGVMGMQSGRPPVAVVEAASLFGVEVTREASFSSVVWVDAIDFFSQVMTSWGAFSSACDGAGSALDQVPTSTERCLFALVLHSANCNAGELVSLKAEGWMG